MPSCRHVNSNLFWSAVLFFNWRLQSTATAELFRIGDILEALGKNTDIFRMLGMERF